MAQIDFYAPQVNALLTAAGTAVQPETTGDLADLTTENKDNLVAAINEVKASAGGDYAERAEAAAEAAEAVLESIPEDYSDLSDEVSDLKSALTDVDDMISPVKGIVEANIGEIRSNTLLRDTGLTEYNSNENFKASNFIEVTPGSVIYISTQNIWGYGLVCFYSSNGTCFTELSISAENSGTPTVLSRYEITIPNDVYKIVIGAYGATPKMETIGYVIDNNLLRKSASTLKDKKITIIGDSITEHNYWAKTNWGMWLTKMTGCTVQNLGISGSGFWYTSPYIDRISQIAVDTDVIGVAVSFNDLGHGKDIGTFHDTGTGTICGYANDFFTALNTAFPTTPIICYSQGTWADIRPGIDYTGGNVLLQEMAKVCAKHGVPYYFDMYEKGSVLKAWIAANKTKYYKCDDPDSEHYGEENGTHPNSEGHKAIANYLIDKFETNVLNLW